MARTDPSGAWRAGRTSGGRRVWRFYLDPAIEWRSPGTWVVRGRYRSAEQALSEILLRVLDTLPGGLTSWNESWREPFAVGEGTDVGMSMEDALAMWEGYVEDGDEQGPTADDPEADLAAVQGWEEEQKQAPWLLWLAWEGKVALIAIALGLTNFDAGDPGAVYDGGGADDDPYSAAMVIACGAVPMLPPQLPPGYVPPPVPKNSLAWSAASAWGSITRMLDALRRRREGNLWGVAVRLYVEDTGERIDPETGEVLGRVPAKQKRKRSRRKQLTAPKRKRSTRRDSSSTSKRKASGASGANRKSRSRSSVTRKGAKRSGAGARRKRRSRGASAKRKK